MAIGLKTSRTMNSVLAIALSVVCGQALAQAVNPSTIALAIAKASQVAASPSNPPAQFLFQRLARNVNTMPLLVTADLTASAWRVGSVDGPAASPEQLHEALKHLQGVLIAGRCGGNAPSTRLCAMPLDAPSHAGIASTLGLGQVLGWVATADNVSVGARGRYFGLLTPHYYTTPSSATLHASLVMRYDSAPHALFDAALVQDSLQLVIHSDARGLLATLPNPDPGGAIQFVSADTKR